jgi:hypothetical protein
MENTKTSVISSNSTSNRNDEVKVFLKVKKVEVENDKTYYKIHEDKQGFTLIERTLESNMPREIPLDKIFTDNDPNSYIFEEVCLNTIEDSIKGKNFCFFSYGETNSEKKSIIFGGEDCYKNINSRGLFLRFLDKFLFVMKENNNQKMSELSLNASYMCVNSNKLIDLSNFIGKEISNYSQSDVFKKAIEIKTNQDITTNIKKFPISLDENLNDIIQFLNKVFDLFYKLEVYESRLYSKSHFIFVLNLVNNNTNDLVSTITFCILAGSEKLSTPATNPTGIRSSGRVNTETSIDNHYTFLSIINGISTVKRSDYINNPEILSKISPDDSKLTICLKRFVFSSPNTKFRVIGCIYPNTGYESTVKDTLMFLFDCKKAIDDKSKTKSSFIFKPQEIKRDDVIYDLENKIKNQEKKIVELNEKILQKQKKIETLEINFKKNLETIKGAFNFEGDINVLNSNNEYTKEAKYARSIRDAMDMVRIKTKRISEMEKIIEDLKEEIKKLKIEQELKENDRTMVKIFTKLKEDQIHEENKLKLTLDNSKQLDELKSRNKHLEMAIEKYKKDLEEKTKLIHNLPTVLKDNININKDFSTKKEELKSELEKNFQKTLRDEKLLYQNEIKIITEKYENILNQKKVENDTVKGYYANLKNNFDREIKKHLDELTKLYDLFAQLTNNYKKYFDSKKISSTTVNSNNSVSAFTNFLKSKDEFDKIFDNVNHHITRYHFPHMFSAVDEGKGVKIKFEEEGGIKFEGEKKHYKADTKKLLPLSSRNIYDGEGVIGSANTATAPVKKELSISASDIQDEVDKIKPEKTFTREELDVLEKVDLFDIISNLQEKIILLNNFFDKIVKSKRGYAKLLKSSVEDEQMLKLFNENEKLRRKLEDHAKVNNNNKISIKSQERMIEKLNSENFFLKNTFNKKQTTEKLNNHLPVFIHRPESGSGIPLLTSMSSPKRTQSAQSNHKTGFKFRPGTAKTNITEDIRPMTAHNFHK